MTSKIKNSNAFDPMKPVKEYLLMKKQRLTLWRRLFISLAIMTAMTAIMPVFAQSEQYPIVFLEAESFSNPGGWFLDTQYMDQMGSPVLLAHGWGNPVKDASTKLIFPKKGEYRLFVRTRNWVAPWTQEHAPGRFQIGIDGKLDKTIFGVLGNPWNWFEGQKVIIPQDHYQAEISLHDLTGFDGRIDALCFSSDPNFIPPNNKKDLAAFRKKMLNIPDQIPAASAKPFDLVVVGAGVSGICAAISAARYGLNVALVQDRPVLGGNNSSEIRVHLCGKINKDPYPNLGNLTWMMGPHAGGNGGQADHYKDQLKLDLCNAEKTLHLFLNTHINRVETKKKNGHYLITAAYGVNTASGQPVKFEGKLFADCTGDGTLGFLAGADYRMGRESRSETGEKLAPEKGDKMTMGASIQWNTVAEKHPTSFPILPWAIQFSPETIKPLIHGDWDWETGMNKDQIEDAEQIRDNGLRAAYGHWSYMKNKMDGPWAEKVKNLNFGWVSCVAGKRESRRLLGDVILKEQDITGRTNFSDATVTTTWPIDLHYPEPNNARFFPGEEFRSIAPSMHIEPYAIPYRCFYSRNVDNLFMAGRNISVTHIALGSTRVMRTCGMIGEVVGMAAAVCRDHDCLPRKVYQSWFSEVQDKMKKGIAPPTPGLKLMTLPDWMKHHGDNFALRAKTEVSGTLVDSVYSKKYINDGKFNVKSNVERWVSSRSGDADNRHWVIFTFDKTTELNAFFIVSGQTGVHDPIRDFVFQYEKNGKFFDIPETIVLDNQTPFIAMKFPAVKSKTFRLFITGTPGNIARIWETELYRVK